MDRRNFFAIAGAGVVGTIVGCRNRQHAHILDKNDPDMVGSHNAGASTWKPLVQESVGQLLGRHSTQVVPVSGTASIGPYRRRICFVGVENHSAEEIGDFKEQIYELIDTSISRSDVYSLVSRRYVDAGLRQTRLRPDELFTPSNQRLFASALEQMESPVDFLLFAKITSGTTDSNGSDYQRDYTLTLELVDIRSGEYDKEAANIRKGYHKSRLGRIKHYAGDTDD